ncbi:uncharacterized protein LOC127720812 [Mytilus californianus]|uniref:uncharacterized protein LOC127720812 n=1 Tax=Mytilus californianus TaxID=6549 RepID=UPI0022461462|nr:uncharacterized protein LOC127720812 [Mytilus californianus]
MQRHSLIQDKELRRQPQRKLSCQTLLRIIRSGDFSSGVLRKRKKRAWPRCFAVLYQGHGYFFWDEISSSEPFMNFYLQDTRVHVGDEINQEDENLTFEFHLTNRGDRFIFAASSQRELEYWINGFRKEIQYANGENRTTPSEHAYISLVDRQTSVDHYDEIHDVLPTLPVEFQPRRRPRPASENVISAITNPGVWKRLSAPVLRTTSPDLGLTRIDSTQDVSPSQPGKCRSSSASFDY